jgi:hypothetical protein
MRAIHLSAYGNPVEGLDMVDVPIAVARCSSTSPRGDTPRSHRVGTSPGGERAPRHFASTDAMALAPQSA